MLLIDIYTKYIGTNTYVFHCCSCMC